MTTSKRHARTEQLLGEEGLETLKGAHVTICGLGAVGSFAAEALARAGVGHLSLVDYDVVSESNINRQLYALTSTVGQKKSAVAEARIKDINPECKVTIFDCFIDEETTEAILDRPMDVVVDAIDSLSSKVHLILNAKERGIPTVSSMGAAGKIDANAITCGDLSETQVCGLAKSVRRRLHRKGLYEGVRCVYSTEPSRKNPSTTGEEPSDDGFRVAPVLGSISYLTAIFGLKAAGEAIGIILKKEHGEGH
ncbi:tRNA threonylcarbamoyladenosine dehydratase [Desulfoluna spongiiphila]|uniref:tRNA A37 threonylcarbamoyladenosine dehydratase n=1 Tax=Desulfoluna spongiiphila TaxID=419481 RepID=A0A1G5HJA8_9BACT|nr:tRNA threonylcarbamoyladenosine dehydratase [Desulfoluna spongiiphila]SCY63539.1 tRNA A37 threonylcarbamoyladenosine dehydratase [Desulfoluna spongiiphila]VVS93462.1 ubiquitin-activating enzyme [Desulfoluna spongiiphila]